MKDFRDRAGAARLTTGPGQIDDPRSLDLRGL
jgi:hypothetical protein